MVLQENKKFKKELGGMDRFLLSKGWMNVFFSLLNLKSYQIFEFGSLSCFSSFFFFS